MRIVFAFIALISSAVLWMLPLTEAVYDFRTDNREDYFVVFTEGANTTCNTTLLFPVYNNDTMTISYTSNVSEAPIVSSYNGTTRELITANLTANVTRGLYVYYDINALSHSASLDTLVDWTPYIWYILLLAFPACALVAIFWYR